MARTRTQLLWVVLVVGSLALLGFWPEIVTGLFGTIATPAPPPTQSVAHRVSPGIPFIERDGGATLVCVSSGAGTSLPPFVQP